MVDVELTGRRQKAVLAGVARTQADGQANRAVVVVVMLALLQFSQQR
jgi:hypothetical protein